VELLQIEAERVLALEQESLAQHVRRDERIAVPVAADPASHAQERGKLHIAPGRVHGGELVLQGGVEARQLLEEGVVVIGQAVHHLVDDLEPVAAQDAGLPQGEDRPAQGFLAHGLLVGGQLLPVALG
jgi:hypothetical protein